MPVLAWIVMTPSEKDAATLLNDEEAMLGAREVTNSLANNLGYTDLNPLVGKWVAPARLLNDPDYARWVPTLGALPVRTMDSETLFVPPPPMD